MALITQFEPINPNEPVSSGYSFVDFDLENNDTGAIYDSGSLSSGILGYLGNQLLELPSNSHYGTLENLMGDWNVSIRGTPTGDIYHGWANLLHSDGSVLLGHGDDYDQWASTPGANTMALTVRIPLSQLELDGIAGYNPATDARIELGTETVQNAFVGHQTGGFPSKYADGLTYQVIPEPGTGLLIGLGCACVFLCRKLLGGNRD